MKVKCKGCGKEAGPDVSFNIEVKEDDTILCSSCMVTYTLLECARGNKPWYMCMIRQ